MNLKSMVKYKKILILGALFLLLSVSRVSADYNSVSLSPSSGSITASGTILELKVNSGADEYIGIDLDISFTGSVEYVPSAHEEVGCSNLNVTTKSEGTINVECFYVGETPDETYNGVVARLKFKATGSGTSTFTLSNIDPQTTTPTGGTYTLSENTDPPGDPDDPPGDPDDPPGDPDNPPHKPDNPPHTPPSGTGKPPQGTEMPKTALFDGVKGKVLMGLGLMMSALVWIFVSPVIKRSDNVYLVTSDDSLSVRRGGIGKQGMRDKV